MIEKIFFKILSILGMIVVLSLNVKAQNINIKQEIESIKTNVINFLIEEKVLEKCNSLEEYNKRIFIIEASNQTLLGSEKIGIYVFGVNTSHTKRYLLIRNSLDNKILDPDHLGLTLKDVNDFLLQNGLSDGRILEYTESVINTYKYNQNRYPGNLKGK
ncbi:hypothetical protein QNI19_12260 [Cytophagaceae bacterium DM2B3-1]|uniref:TPM domain-containing protein n=1 Tax=Xanthocytophaga flava TaxID=3048013 RepID=A0ABT7CJ20_9BACT|nr:hypothetical protein [Xanthocytophaga flavus]MDJ1493707.1 hypothetical protein [Xanthocytophaga flavus]